MIKILALIMLLATSNVFAHSSEKSPFKGKQDTKPLVYTECRAGQLFVIAASDHGIAIIQAFKDTSDMVPKPIECGDNNE